MNVFCWFFFVISFVTDNEELDSKEIDGIFYLIS